jgi:lipopolysaccharide transport system ATP-binding protein
MSSPVIKVENLSKQYRLDATQGYKTFRETIVKAAKAPFRNFRKSNPQSAIRNPQFDTIWALKDVSFDVKQGEVVGIIGRNGAGKSTLLKILTRITEPTRGRAELKGRVGSLLEVGTGFHPELTGHENIYLYGAILGMDRWEVTQKFDEIVAFAGLEKFIETPVKRYSSGMYMRLAFAVAAFLEPDILLIDEVLAVGDAVFQKKCIGKMDDISKQGRTVIFVSHNMPAILNLCGRAILLEKGKNRKSGKSQEVVNYYLTDGKSPSGKIYFTAEEGGSGPEFYFYSASVLKSGERETAQTLLKDEVVIQVEYEITASIRRLVLVLELIDSNGTYILSSTDKDQNPSAVGEIRKPGRYIAKCHIPNTFLRPGRYYINLRASIPMVRVLADLPCVLSFDVLDVVSLPSKIGQGRKGVISPVLRWDLSTTKETEIHL